jgi:CRISPR-associated protein Csx16
MNENVDSISNRDDWKQLERPLRLIGFLGTTEYSKTQYRWDSHTTRESKYASFALADILKPDETLIMVTPQARAKHWTNLSDTFNNAQLHPPKDIPISAGQGQQDLWPQFNQLKDHLSGQQHKPAPRTVILDISNGFRSTPFFAAASAMFVRAVEKDAPHLKVVYAPFVRGQDETPIQDLTRFVELLDWSLALLLFLNTGRSSELATPLKEIGRALNKEWALAGRAGPQPTLSQFEKALNNFALELATVRTGKLLIGRNSKASTVKRLLQSLDSTRAAIQQHIPPLAAVLDRIEDMARRLNTEHLHGPEGKTALANLARIYLDMGRHLEAAATLREGFITAFSDISGTVPGTEEYSGPARDIGIRRWFQSDQHQFHQVANVRNDLEHAGYRKDPMAPASIDKVLEDCHRAFVDLQATIPEEPPAPAGKRFLNLSNHPHSTWSQEQRQAALVECTEIIDQPFPNVPPEADQQHIEELAAAILTKLPVDINKAMIMGEFTLTAALIRDMQKRGVECLAATTRRQITTLEDGSKQSSFHFQRFRPYPAFF